MAKMKRLPHVNFGKYVMSFSLVLCATHTLFCKEISSHQNSRVLVKCEGTLLKVCQVVTEDIFPSVILSDLFPLQKASFDACQNAFLLNLLCWQVPCFLRFCYFNQIGNYATLFVRSLLPISQFVDRISKIFKALL